MKTLSALAKVFMGLSTSSSGTEILCILVRLSPLLLVSRVDGDLGLLPEVAAAVAVVVVELGVVVDVEHGGRAQVDALPLLGRELGGEDRVLIPLLASTPDVGRVSKARGWRGVRRSSPQTDFSCILSSVAPLWVRLELEPRLAGPSHPARPDPPLVAPRDPQEHLQDLRGVPQRVQMWHDQATNPTILRIPILRVVFELNRNLHNVN